MMFGLRAVARGAARAAVNATANVRGSVLRSGNARPRIGMTTALLVLLVITAPVRSQCDTPRMTDPHGVAGDSFGASSCVSGDWVIVGAPMDDGFGADSGAAHVFRFDAIQGSWTYHQSLSAPGGAAGDRFGTAVSISGVAAIVGADGRDAAAADVGAAYVFRYDADSGFWVDDGVLAAADGKGRNFGFSVSVRGDVAIVGSVRESNIVSISGAARFYRRNASTGAWVQEGKVRPPAGTGNDRFGVTVAIDGDAAVVGAPWDSATALFAGAAHAYRRQGAAWVHDAALRPADGEQFESFGTSVSIDGASIVVGAESDDDNGFSAGSVYVYLDDGAGWVVQAKLLASDGGTSDRFGSRVSVSGQAIIVGAPQDAPAGSASGSAYLYRFDGTTWGDEVKLVAAGAAAGEQFGASVCIDGDRAVGGAPGAGGGGAAIAFAGASGADCDGNGVADGCDILDCAGLDGNGDGVPDGCAGAAATYVGPPGGSWFIASHWSSGVVPTLSNDVVVTGEVVVGSGVATAQSVRVVCGGRLTLAGGTLASLSTTITSGGRLDGSGVVAGPVVNDGTISPGNPIGLLQVSSSYTQTPMGTLHLDLGGAQSGITHDRLAVSGRANLDGVLTASIVAPHAPSAGQVLQVLTYGSVVGAFATPLLPPLDADLTFRGRYRTNWLRLLVVEAEAVSPCAAGSIPGAPHFMSVGDDIALIGATVYRHDSEACESGVCLSWVVEQVLAPPDGSSVGFGRAAAADGDRIIVGDNIAGDDGLAYAYQFDGSTWSLVQTLAPFGSAAANRFGWSVALRGDVAIIGTFWGTGNGPPGTAYVFRHDGASWVGEAVLSASDGADNGGLVDGFGQSLALDGDAVLVGAFNDDDNGFTSGSAYVFRYGAATGQWVQEAKLLASDGAPVNYFGHTVAMEGDVAVLGATGLARGVVSQSGYVFKRAAGQWVEQVELAAPIDVTNAWFQTKIVALSGNVVAVSTYNDDGAGSTAGSVYMFHDNGWSWEAHARLLPAASPPDWFGYSAAATGHTVIVASFDPLQGTVQGVEFFQGADGSDCNGNGIGDACDIREGTSFDADGDGVPDECAVTLGDLNGDGVVNGVDLSLLLAAWGACPPSEPCPADLNGDGVVDFQDLQILLSNWG